MSSRVSSCFFNLPVEYDAKRSAWSWSTLRLRKLAAPRVLRWLVAYDPLAESLALLAHGVREDPRRLSRRRRFAALAVDVDGDVAGTLFVVRGPGHVRFETHALAREAGTWRVLGGGSGGRETDGLADRPPAAELGGPVAVAGGGSVALGSGWAPWSGRYVRYALLQAGAEVHTVDVGSRMLTVPRHGHLLVVWSTPRPPRAVARDADGRELAALDLSGR